jgi:uncharacterized protein involved in propanediol utilization
MSGVGASEHHHGEILQGAVRRGAEVVPCLITMPARRVGSRARYEPGGHMLEVVPAWKLKAARAARLALEFVGAPAGGGRLEIECSVATGVGLGSSTCDVVAAIRAVCAAYGVAVEPDVVARLAVAAEGAVDPIMFDREVVLFAQRQGYVLETFGSWIPPYVVVSIDTDAGTRGVDTLSLPPPQYTDAELDAFEALVARARTAFEGRDVAAIAAVATESAAVNQRFLPLRCFCEIVALAGEFRALGVQIAHSGTVAGILFDTRTARANPELTSEVIARVRSFGARPLGVFATGADSD